MRGRALLFSMMDSRGSVGPWAGDGSGHMSESLATQYLEAWNSRQGDAVALFMTDDVDFEDVTLGKRMHGRDAVKEFVERFSQTFSSDYHFELVTEFVSGASLAAEWSVSGHHDRDSPALPATHKPFTIRGATMARLEDGKISYNRDYWDMATFLREVGVLPSG
jgi:steroid delta-isomerase-like uncharacterized protein